jgi:hypothetical protein
MIGTKNLVMKSIKQFAFKLLLFSFLIFSGIAKAQSTKLEVRFAGGPNRSSLYGNKAIDSSNPLYGITGDLSLEYHFNRFVSILPGISYNEKGNINPTVYTDTLGNPLATADIKTKLKYLNVPLLIRFTFGNRFKFYFNTGPYLGLLQNAKTITPSIGSIEATEFNIDSTLKEQEWGVSLGLGIAFPITKRLNLGLELRNDAGLQNISDLTINNNGKIKTNETSALFSISYILIKSKDKDKDKEKDD